MGVIEDLEAELNFFRTKIEKLERSQRTPDKIREIVGGKPFDLEEKSVEAISRYFETLFEVTQAIGSAITETSYVPWLRERMKAKDFDDYYWTRQRKYLENEIKLAPDVINILHQVGTDILDFCGDPKDSGSFQRRGMVIGHVQSGKTSSYSALIAKAADAGYKVIILLAGISNNLREQTQDRIDNSFIGRRSVFRVRGEPIGVARHAQIKRYPFFGTTIDKDFNLNAFEAFGVPIQNLTEPCVFVVKKNTSTLKNLLGWLKLYHPNGDIEQPLLLIDDEADNASINTRSRQNDITTINRGIRDILVQFKRASYVGYTATPFANIFINPENRDKMLGEDLFPRDFIQVLEPPDNYVGPEQVFSESSKLSEKMIKMPDDYEDLIPLKHKNHHPISVLPDSLNEAFYLFILIRAIRILQGQGKTHCTMMVNVSRFNSVQRDVQNVILQLKSKLEDEFRMYSKKTNGVEESDILAEFKILFDREFRDTCAKLENVPLETGFTEIKKYLVEAISSIDVKLVNMGGGTLDYDKYENDGGRHIVAVGGFALSRGLTLEGLCVSYVLRNPSAYDTLMQMGRWFGYRPGYKDLCRLYIPRFARNYYRHIWEATEELREEIRIMARSKLTPKDYGLRVREHPEAIRITAANKMDSAEQITVALSYAEKHVEGHIVHTNKDIVESNAKLTKEFLKSLGTPVVPEGIRATSKLFWSEVDLYSVRQFLMNFQFPKKLVDLHVTDGNSLILTYMDDRKEELENWDVVVLENTTSSAKNNSDLLSGKPIKMRERNNGFLDDLGYFHTTGRRRLAQPGDPSNGLLVSLYDEIEKNNDKSMVSDRILNFNRTKPLLLVHVFSGETREPKESVGNLISCSLCFPKIFDKEKRPVIERKYSTNVIYQQLDMFDELDSTEVDEELEGAEL